MAIQIPIITSLEDSGIKAAKAAFNNFKQEVGKAEGAMGKFKAGGKAALSGPSVCLRARAPCPLRVSCLRSIAWIAPSSRSGAPVPHPPGPRGRAARAAGLRSSGWLLGIKTG